jgi:hypothetical protein
MDRPSLQHQSKKRHCGRPIFAKERNSAVRQPTILREAPTRRSLAKKSRIFVTFGQPPTLFVYESHFLPATESILRGVGPYEVT